jgi:hypothetical protein
MESLPDTATFNVLTYDLTKSSNVYLGQIAANTLNKTNQTAMNASDIASASGKLSDSSSAPIASASITPPVISSPTVPPVASTSASITPPAASTSAAANDADYGFKAKLSGSRIDNIVEFAKKALKAERPGFSDTIADSYINAKNLVKFNNTDKTHKLGGASRPESTAHSVEFYNKATNAWLEVPKMPAFAKGGVTNKASIFGEAGWEAAVPLPDGRSIPVIIQQAPSKQDDSEVVAVLTDGFEALLDRIEKLERALTTEQRKTTTVTAQANDKFYTAQSAQKMK